MHTSRNPAYGGCDACSPMPWRDSLRASPPRLVQKLLEVEDELGRVRDPKEKGHGPRTIDCDLLWVEGEEHAGARLTLPHSHLGERDFVIIPMEDLMHDPERFLVHAGIRVTPREKRVGHVMAELGEISWE